MFPTMEVLRTLLSAYLYIEEKVDNVFDPALDWMEEKLQAWRPHWPTERPTRFFPYMIPLKNGFIVVIRSTSVVSLMQYMQSVALILKQSGVCARKNCFAFSQGHALVAQRFRHFLSSLNLLRFYLCSSNPPSWYVPPRRTAGELLFWNAFFIGITVYLFTYVSSHHSRAMRAHRFVHAVCFKLQLTMSLNQAFCPKSFESTCSAMV